MTVSVVTLHFGELPYFTDSSAVNAEYCALHGYSWSEAGAVENAGRHPVWSKVYLLASKLALFDAVLYIDADAVFVDHATGLEPLLEKLGRKALLFGTDRSGQANTGFILARQCDAAFRILGDWWNVPNFDPKHAHRWPLEQGALNRHVVGKHRHDIELVEPAALFFARHYAGTSLAEKVRRIATDRANFECPSPRTQF